MRAFEFSLRTVSTVLLQRMSMATLSYSSPRSLRKLPDGNEIPILGFGTYEMDGREAYKSVTWALEAGYRHIDSAAWYENESEVGQAIIDFCKQSNVPRSDIFYTTKLRQNNGIANVRKAIQASLNACKLEYIDLYLMHGPVGGPRARAESWQAIREAKQEGKLRSIGVSTFGVKHLKEIVDSGVELPAVHQIDLHPFMTRNDVVSFCQKHNIALQAWGPLVRGMRFKNREIVRLAKKYEKQPAQILLRYSLQKGYIPLPKSVRKERIISNTQIFDFELLENEVKELDQLDEYLITDWDPTECA